jgi:uncharacterized membrane protein
MKTHLKTLSITVLIISFIGFAVWALENYEQQVVNVLAFFSIFSIALIVYLLVYREIQASQKK